MTASAPPKMQDRTDHIIRPKGAWLTVNRRCNFRCKWCYGQGTDFGSDKTMTLSFASKMVHLLAEAKVENIVITGGEPTLWKPLFKLNALCQSLGLKTTLVTNAMRFGYDPYWQEYLKCPNTMANISLKAGSPKQLLETTGIHQHGVV